MAFLPPPGFRSKIRAACVNQDADKRMPKRGMHWALGRLTAGQSHRQYQSTSLRLPPTLPPPRGLSLSTKPNNLITYLDISLGSSHTHWSGVYGTLFPSFCSDDSSTGFSAIAHGLAATVGYTAGQFWDTVESGLLTLPRRNSVSSTVHTVANLGHQSLIHDIPVSEWYIGILGSWHRSAPFRNW